jgi:hypothetical protein
LPFVSISMLLVVDTWRKAMGVGRKLAFMPFGMLTAVERLDCQLVSIRKLRMGHERFSIRKLGIFCPDKEIKGLRGGVLLYVAQARPMIDAARATIRLHRIGQHLLPAG